MAIGTYAPQRILCTGGAGFIGRHVVRKLAAQGHQVTVVDALDERVHPSGEPPTFPDNVTFHQHMVDSIPYTLLREQDRVIHLAAQVSVADSMTDYRRYVDQNSYQTAVLLEDLRCNVDLVRLVVASSMSAYGTGGFGVRETDPLVPKSVYGLTKYDQERMALIWGESRRVQTLALRYFNVYGPEQSLTNGYTGVLANFANALLKDEAPIIFEDGGQSRDFVFVDDIADVTVHACLADLHVHGAYNVCTGEPTTILTAARLMAEALGKGHIEPHLTGKPRDGDVRHCTGNPNLTADRLGWAYRVPFSLGIKRYCQWLKR